MGDITLRALETLRGADVIACEDTRVTGRLLSRHGIDAPMTPYHDHNAERARGPLLDRMARGEAVALVSDAGTPLLSDPGFKLVRAAIEAGIAVTAIPGPTAAVAGLILSGLPSDRFFFAGFLPAKHEARIRALREIAAVPGSLVFYESPARLAAALGDMAEVLGPRPAAVARELTKLYEEVRRAPLPDLAEQYEAEGPPKGEVVVIVAPPEAPKPADAATLDELLKTALADHSLRDAAALVAGETGLPRRVVYARAVQLAGKA
jgi:16S rRNA (cytidine1402-2'-O)-methyltransferase